jgi:hypothetical protein
MKTDELKLRVIKFVNNTIDLYIPPTNFFDKLKNSTAKLWVEQNQWRFAKAIEAFGDEHDEIDTDRVMAHYEHSLFDNGELRLDIKSMIPDSFGWLKEYLPNKIILFKVDDFRNIFR